MPACLDGWLLLSAAAAALAWLPASHRRFVWMLSFMTSAVWDGSKISSFFILNLCELSKKCLTNLSLYLAVKNLRQYFQNGQTSGKNFGNHATTLHPACVSERAIATLPPPLHLFRHTLLVVVTIVAAPFFASAPCFPRKQNEPLSDTTKSQQLQSISFIICFGSETSLHSFRCFRFHPVVFSCCPG